MPKPSRTVLICRSNRTGSEAVECDSDGRYFVTATKGSHESEQEVTKETARLYYIAMAAKKGVRP